MLPSGGTADAPIFAWQAWPALAVVIPSVTAAAAVAAAVTNVWGLQIVTLLAGGIALLIPDVAWLLQRTGAWLQLFMLHGGLVLGVAGLFSLGRPSRAVRSMVIAGFAAVLGWMLLPGGGGLLIARERLAIADFEMRALVLCEWLLAPIALLSMTMAMTRARTVRFSDHAFLAALLLLWHPARLALELSFEISSVDDFFAIAGQWQMLPAALVGRLWIAVGLSALLWVF